MAGSVLELERAGHWIVVPELAVLVPLHRQVQGRTPRQAARGFSFDKRQTILFGVRKSKQDTEATLKTGLDQGRVIHDQIQTERDPRQLFELVAEFQRLIEQQQNGQRGSSFEPEIEEE